MIELPTAILSYLGKMMVEKHALAYLLIDRQGCLKAFGGELSRYGIEELSLNQLMTDQLFFLAGMLPFDGPPLQLSYVKVSAGLSADIHVFSTDEGDWVLLLDVTEAEQKYGLMQQRVNDLSLLRDQQLRIINQYLGNKIAGQLEPEKTAFQEQGERKELAVLCADIKNLQFEQALIDAETTLATVDLYWRAVAPAIADEGGFISNLVGDRLIVIFGALPTTDLPARQALRAALRMLEMIARLNHRRTEAQLATLDLGIGIASGLAIIGFIGTKDQRSINIIGDTVKLAAHLTDHTANNQLLIDERCFAVARELARLFTAETLNLPGIAALQVFSHQAQ